MLCFWLFFHWAGDGNVAAILFPVGPKATITDWEQKRCGHYICKHYLSPDTVKSWWNFLLLVGSVVDRGSISLFCRDGGTAAPSWLMLPGAQQLQDQPPRLLPGALPSLASAKGHGTLYLCPCPGPRLLSTYLIEGQAWPRGACQEPLSVGPPGTRLGGGGVCMGGGVLPRWLHSFLKALGRLIGLLCRVPLWGSAQACSSCWVRRR